MAPAHTAAPTSPQGAPMRTAADQQRFTACREHIHAALIDAARQRSANPDWVAAERLAVATAANQWAAAHGLHRTVTVDDVERIEVCAIGHVDYATKLSLYVTEFIFGIDDPLR